MPDLSERLYAPEQMDDFDRPAEELAGALQGLRGVNRWLGGGRTVKQALRPLLGKYAHLRILDLGAGGGDVPAQLVKWADAQCKKLTIVAVDANSTVVRLARRDLDDRIPSALRSQVRVETGNALDLPYGENDFDVVIASLFLHHFTDENAVRLLREMKRIARHGLIVSDLHRHLLAYLGIQTLSKLLPVSPMFANDAPLSVRRGFTYDEMDMLAGKAGLTIYSITWRWAFRWVLSTLER